MKIPFFNYPDLYLKNKDKLIDIFSDVGSRGAFIMQKDLEEFEHNIAEYTGSKYALGVANATDGLQIALMAGGLKEGSEVIISSHTMIATASAIHYAGAKPVPVEAGSDLMIDPSSLEEAINDNTSAIMPTQLNGRTCDMDCIMSIADKYSLDVYEDAAQALGSKFKNKAAGTFGIASAISLYPAKLLGCLGDGGIVLTNEEEVYKKLSLLRDHGRDPDSGEVSSWGFNTRLDNMQAAFLNFFMSDYDDIVKRRRQIASLYNEGLSSIEQITLPTPPNDGDHFDVFQNYEIQAHRRDDLKSYMSEKGIGSLVQWSGKAVHQFDQLKFSVQLPKTDELFLKILMIPLNMSITDEEVEYVIETIKEFYKG